MFKRRQFLSILDQEKMWVLLEAVKLLKLIKSMKKWMKFYKTMLINKEKLRKLPNY